MTDMEKHRQELQRRLDLARTTLSRVQDALVVCNNVLDRISLERECDRLKSEIAELERELDELPQPYRGTIVPVRVFFILAPSCTPELATLFLQQNQCQDMFELDIASWEIWQGQHAAENVLQSLHTDSRLEFCDKFQQEMNKYNQAFDGLNPEQINLAITELPFPKNYYSWNTEDRKGIVIGIHSLRLLFQEKPEVLTDSILLVAKRMLIYSRQIPGLEIHKVTKGCVFDYTIDIRHIQHAATIPNFCKTCKAFILAQQEKESSNLLEALEKWIKS
jgi:hypothetical protein